MSLTGLDHLVIMVLVLERAVQAYRDLGFTVVPGGEHPGGTHNALIAFADGAYIELIAFKAPAPDHRWWDRQQRGGGLIDFCVGATDLAGEIGTFRRAGVDLSDPVPGARRRPDGVQVAWRSALPRGDAAFQVPFIIEDTTPRTVRVPGDTAHANGALGIDTLTVAVRDLETVRAWWAGIVGTPGAEVWNTELEAVGTRHRLGPHSIELMAPVSDAGPLAERLRTHGPSPYAVALKSSLRPPRDLDERTASARITLG